MIPVGSVFCYIFKSENTLVVAVHSVMNKTVGGLLFVLPLTLKIIDLRYSAVIVCFVATFAAIQEGYSTNKLVT